MTAIKEPILVGGLKLLVTTSLGIALYPDEGRVHGTLVRNADIAMYRDKENGRDGWQWYSSVSERQTAP
jgi:GGDEF domain-containing protein